MQLDVGLAEFAPSSEDRERRTCWRLLEGKKAPNLKIGAKLAASYRTYRNVLWLAIGFRMESRLDMSMHMHIRTHDHDSKMTKCIVLTRL